MESKDFMTLSEWLQAQSRRWEEVSARCAVAEQQMAQTDWRGEAERQAELAKFLEGAAQGFQDISFQLKDEGEKRKGFCESLRGLGEL